jgi:hypothetical protein
MSIIEESARRTMLGRGLYDISKGNGDLGKRLKMLYRPALSVCQWVIPRVSVFEHDVVFKLLSDWLIPIGDNWLEFLEQLSFCHFASPFVLKLLNSSNHSILTGENLGVCSAGIFLETMNPAILPSTMACPEISSLPPSRFTRMLFSMASIWNDVISFLLPLDRL